MYCSHCGAQLSEDAQFCAACGTATSVAPARRVRPAIVTLLAVLKFVAAFGWLFLGLALVAFSGTASDRTGLLFLAVVFVALGGVALACGYGLWTLRPYGRYIQMSFSFFGLLGFPLQTIISILILVYMFKPGVRVLFSGTPIENLGPVEQAQLRSLQTSSAAAIVIAIAVAIPMGIAIMGIIAAIAIPNFLNAVDRGKQKRTMADLRSLAAAVESYAVDNKIYPTATTAAGLEPLIAPVYIKTMPMVDGWGNEFQVDSSRLDYTIYSQGKDRTGSNCTPGPTSRFDDETCFANGQFMRYPEGLAR